MSKISLVSVVMIGLLFFSCALQEEDPVITDQSNTEDLDTNLQIPQSCTTMTVAAWKKDMIYSWIDWHADGHMDTVFSNNQPSQRLYKKNTASIIETIVLLSYDTIADTLVCPEDSLWIGSNNIWNEQQSLPPIYNWRPAGIDTVYLNYTDAAQRPLERSQVTITNKQEILNTLDTLEFYQSIPLIGVITQTPEWDDILWTYMIDSNSVIEQLRGSAVKAVRPVSCPSDFCGFTQWSDSLKNMCEQPRDLQMSHQSAPAPVAANLTKDTEPGVHTWKIKVTTRLGYTDSLEGQSVVLDWRARCEE